MEKAKAGLKSTNWGISKGELLGLFSLYRRSEELISWIADGISDLVFGRYKFFHFFRPRVEKKMLIQFLQSWLRQ